MTNISKPDQIEYIVQSYGNMLFRLCVVMLGNTADAENVVQETFIQYFRKAPHFENEAHEKSWLFTVAANKCKDELRFRVKHPISDIETTELFHVDAGESGILDALMLLPEKYRIVLVLYYVEEYPVKEIAKIIGKSTSAVKMRLQKGRKLLAETYRKEFA